MGVSGKSCTALAFLYLSAKPEGSSVSGRRHAVDLFEGSGKVTLIEEAGGNGDFAERGIRSGKLSTSEFDSHLPNVLTDCSLVMAVEFSS
jgi:hypothetical protein